jgi:hypothetical protein
MKTLSSPMVYMLSVLLIALLSVSHMDAYSQSDEKGHKTVPAEYIGWSEGSILFNEGTELKGFLNYNDKTGLLSFEQGSDSQSFRPRDVVGFEFYDEQTSRQRIFYTFSYEDTQSNIKQPLFFEVVRELERFTVLAKSDPLNVRQKTLSTPATYNNFTGMYSSGSSVASGIEVSQIETIYIMDKKGSISPFTQIVSKEIDGVFFDRSKSKNKLLDKDLLEQYIGKEMYEKVMDYARKNSFKFQNKDDLFKILDYYSEISK